MQSKHSSVHASSGLQKDKKTGEIPPGYGGFQSKRYLGPEPSKGGLANPRPAIPGVLLRT